MSPVPYGMVPGQRHELPGITVPDASPPPDDINLDAPPPPAPYGMEPGKRHFLPGITPLLQQSSPLSGSQPQAPAQPPEDESQYRDANGHEYGISFMLDGKRVELKPNLEASSEHRGRQINELGQALMKHAHTDAEKEAAERAAAWGLAQSDTDIPIEHVMKSMDESYRKDTGYEAALAKQALVNQGKMDAVHAAHPWGLGGGGPSLKQDKFNLQENQAQTQDLSGLVEAERKNYDFKANQQTQQSMRQALAKMRSPNALSQRIAVMEELKALTGKQQTAREQMAINNAAGVLAAWENDWKLKIPGADPQLNDEYRRQFEQAIMQAIQTSQETLNSVGEAGLGALRTSPFYGRMSPEERAQAERHVYGRLTGVFPSEQPQASAPSANPKPSAAPKNHPKSRVDSLLGEQ